jgi:hypothetical protein
MGSGGSKRLWSPGKTVVEEITLHTVEKEETPALVYPEYGSLT